MYPIGATWAQGKPPLVASKGVFHMTTPPEISGSWSLVRTVDTFGTRQVVNNFSLNDPNDAYAEMILYSDERVAGCVRGTDTHHRP